MITTWSCGLADENMPESILGGHTGKVRPHPWRRARARLALALLKKHGSPRPRPSRRRLRLGNQPGALEKSGYRATGFDISRRILEMIDRPDRTLVEFDLNQPLPPNHALFDALLGLNVIEHLDDDRGPLANGAAAQTGGRGDSQRAGAAGIIYLNSTPFRATAAATFRKFSAPRSPIRVWACGDVLVGRVDGPDLRRSRLYARDEFPLLEKLCGLSETSALAAASVDGNNVCL